MTKHFICDANIELFTDALEFTLYFDIVVEGHELDTENVPESAGFCNIEDNTIYLFISKKCSFDDFLFTVSHELGHLIEGGFKKNPPDKVRYHKKHEQKAEHYENFVKKALEISKILYKLNETNLSYSGNAETKTNKGNG